MLWVFKIFAVPAFVALATFVIRRWGAAVGGLLIGLPLMTGPISAFLAIDQGAAFAARSSTGILLAVASMGPWTLTFYWLAPRWRWPGCLLAGLAAFALTSALLQALVSDLRVAAAIACASVFIALSCMPRVRAPVQVRPAPWWDLPVRMTVTAGLVVTVTVLADRVGPRISGILATLPIISGVVLCFTHETAGPLAARALIRGLLTAMIAFIAFFLVVGETVEPWGIALAYSAAVVVALILSVSVGVLDRRLAAGLASPRAVTTKALE